MRNSSRMNKNAVAILAAAAGLAATVQMASAQNHTWVAPNSGNWSVGANWLGGVPASAATTNLLFPGTGAAYSSNNDLANPFTFGTLTVNNSE